MRRCEDRSSVLFRTSNEAISDGSYRSLLSFCTYHGVSQTQSSVISDQSWYTVSYDDWQLVYTVFQGNVLEIYFQFPNFFQLFSNYCIVSLPIIDEYSIYRLRYCFCLAEVCFFGTFSLLLAGSRPHCCHNSSFFLTRLLILPHLTPISSNEMFGNMLRRLGRIVHLCSCTGAWRIERYPLCPQVAQRDRPRIHAGCQRMLLWLLVLRLHLPCCFVFRLVCMVCIPMVTLRASLMASV